MNEIRMQESMRRFVAKVEGFERGTALLEDLISKLERERREDVACLGEKEEEDLVDERVKQEAELKTLKRVYNQKEMEYKVLEESNKRLKTRISKQTAPSSLLHSRPTDDLSLTVFEAIWHKLQKTLSRLKQLQDANAASLHSSDCVFLSLQAQIHVQPLMKLDQ